MPVPFAFEPPGKAPRKRHQFVLRFWTVRHARLMEDLYATLESVIRTFAPLLQRIGFERLERPFAVVEGTIKGALFDCRMCGQCVLSSTGMSCPMNCPKNLRNGPCGGVRIDGSCEVYPEMPCVWVEGYEASRTMRRGDLIAEVQPPIDHRLKGRSTWLALAKENQSLRKGATDRAESR
jgi:hypothetical protein